MIKLINNVFSLFRPARSVLELPIVFDSPHSGTMYPTNSGIVASAGPLKTTWDAYVDELWSAAPESGASLLCARFPRAYIDVNRSQDDIDQELLREPWPAPLSPSDACKRGMGLIRRYALPGVPMYSDPLSIAEVAQRIRRYYEPYHEILESLIDSASARFGSIWHINCHSMKSAGNAMNSDNGRARPDMVVSDRNGASANADFTDWVATELRQLGYQVQINNPYQGGHIIHRYGNPSSGRQSIQIEIKRSLYMNEATFEKTEGFAPLQESLEVFMRNLKRRVEEQLSERQSACSVNP